MLMAPDIESSPEESQRLKRKHSSSTVSVREARRAKIMLLAADGMTNQ